MKAVVAAFNLRMDLFEALLGSQNGFVGTFMKNLIQIEKAVIISRLFPPFPLSDFPQCQPDSFIYQSTVLRGQEN